MYFVAKFSTNYMKFLLTHFIIVVQYVYKCLKTLKYKCIKKAMNFLSGILQYLPASLTSKVVGRDAVFKSTTNKTFENEDSLPSLPVPPLRSTLDHYLETVRPVVTDEEYEITETICRNFENEVGVDLQKMLIKRSELHKNWVIDCQIDMPVNVCN